MTLGRYHAADILTPEQETAFLHATTDWVYAYWDAQGGMN